MEKCCVPNFLEIYTVLKALRNHLVKKFCSIYLKDAPDYLNMGLFIFITIKHLVCIANLVKQIMRKAGTEKARLNKGINDNSPQRYNK